MKTTMPKKPHKFGLGLINITKMALMSRATIIKAMLYHEPVV